MRQQGKSKLQSEWAERALDAGLRVYYPAEGVIKQRRNGVTTAIRPETATSFYSIVDDTLYAPSP